MLTYKKVKQLLIKSNSKKMLKVPTTSYKKAKESKGIML